MYLIEKSIVDWIQQPSVKRLNVGKEKEEAWKTDNKNPEKHTDHSSFPLV